MALIHLRDEKIHDSKFLNENDSRFAEFRKTLDSKMKELLKKGLGTKVKQADPVTTEQESQIWEKEVFGAKNAETLQQTVFFYISKLFGLRAYDEHHDLNCDSVIVGEDGRGKYINFIGRANKTFKGGLAQLDLTSKNIKHYCENGERCIANYFKIYLDALGNEGKFYRRPLAGQPIRYGSQPVGVNKLKSMMKTICSKAGLVGNFTNHSGKRTCATQLFIAGVDEQEIMNRTGHRSEKAVRKYKRSSDEIAKSVSKVLDPPAVNHSDTECIYSMDIDNNGENVILKKRKMSDEKCATSGLNSIKSDLSTAMMDVTNKPVFNNCQVSFNF